MYFCVLHKDKFSRKYGTAEYTKQCHKCLKAVAYSKTVVLLMNIGLCQTLATGLTIELQRLSSFDPYLPEHWPMPG